MSSALPQATIVISGEGLPMNEAGPGSGVQRLISLRWVASCGALAAVVLARVLFPHFQPGPPLALALLIPLSNLGHRALARRHLPVRPLLLVQFGADMLLLTGLIWCAGGVGPLIAFYLLHAILAALLLRRRDAVLIAGAALALIGLVGVLQLALPPAFLPRENLYAAVLGHSFSRSVPVVATLVGVFSIVVAVLLVLVVPVVEEAKRQAARLERAEAEARTEIATLESLTDNLDAALFVLDNRHRLERFNRKAAALMPKAAVGQERRCFDPAEPMGGQKPPQCPTCCALESGQSWQGDYTLATAESGPRIFRVYATPLPPGEAPQRVVELVFDVTEERQLEQSLLEARKTAATAQLAAGVAHEMNTPLASLAAGLRSIRKACTACTAAQNGEKVLSLATELSGQTERCQQIVGSMLGYARELRSHLESAEVTAVVRSAFKELAARRELAGLEVVFKSPGADCPPVSCDPAHLQLALTNVLENAVDSVREARRTKGRVFVRVESRAGDLVAIKVQDNGSGMPAEIQQRIFDPFFTTKPVGEGTGLGLSLAKGLLEGMGATISVDSGLAAGTEVEIRLRAAAGQEVESGGSDA